MTEILTESFCERCGTRYTFESVAPRRRRMTGIRVLGRGLKNFVMSDDSSLDEAMAAARSDAERDATSQQLDAFHRTFNFCMSCRQYTCGNCWNGVEARCLSCAPLALPAEPDTAFEGLDIARRLRDTGTAAGAPPLGGVELIGVAEAEAAHEHRHLPVAPPDWPVPDHAFASDALVSPAVDPRVEPTPAAAQSSEATPEVAPVETGPEGADWDAAAPAGGEPEVPAQDAVIEEPALGDVDSRGTVVEAGTVPPAQAGRLIGLELGESLDEAIAAYEASLVAEAPTAEPELIAAEPEAVAAEPEAVAEPEVVVEPEAVAEPEPVVVEPEAVIEPEAVAEPEPVVVEPAPAPTAEPWPIQPPAATPAGPPQWPTGPRWPTAIPARQPMPTPPPAADPLAALVARHATDAMWAASSRDVVQPMAAAPAQSTAGVKPCVSCGISLSAHARFCRRCGTSQDA